MISSSDTQLPWSIVALATAAVVTTRLKIGTAICLVVERDPIMLAKQVASLDFLSNGRFLFGIGGGWNAEEMENHGTNFKTRWRLLRERVLAMKEIWTKEGWFPIAGRAGDLATGIGTLRRLAEKAGRDPRIISVSVSAASPEESAVREYEKAGVERAIFPPPSADRDKVLPVLDGYATLMRLFR